MKNQRFCLKILTLIYLFLPGLTTPWTLPSNTALAVGANIRYIKVRTYNPYTSEPVTVIIAKDLFRTYFPEKNEGLELSGYNGESKTIPYKLLDEFAGNEITGLNYEQLFPWVRPMGDAFRGYRRRFYHY